jgi:hypothetical protein
MEFIPTQEKLIPDLSPREEVVLLARTLWREGYDDHVAGHITYRQADGTFLCNPWFLLWSEIRAEHIIRIDGDGNVLEGDWPAPLGIQLHLQLHKLREDVTVAMHNHPRYGTIWADAGRVPPVYDQTSAMRGGARAAVPQRLARRGARWGKAPHRTGGRHVPSERRQQVHRLLGGDGPGRARSRPDVAQRRSLR